MASFDDLRRFALTLPEVEATDHFGGPELKVRGKTFALWWAETERTILRLTKPHQELLFEARPEVFQPCKVATVHWAYVDLEQVDEAEIRALVLEAWEAIAPKSVRLKRSAGEGPPRPSTGSG
jgi:hypothetical protein